VYICKQKCAMPIHNNGIYVFKTYVCLLLFCIWVPLNNLSLMLFLQPALWFPTRTPMTREFPITVSACRFVWRRILVSLDMGWVQIMAYLDYLVRLVHISRTQRYTGIPQATIRYEILFDLYSDTNNTTVNYLLNKSSTRQVLVFVHLNKYSSCCFYHTFASISGLLLLNHTTRKFLMSDARYYNLTLKSSLYNYLRIVFVLYRIVTWVSRFA
jgi:hypothetical protein